MFDQSSLYPIPAYSYENIFLIQITNNTQCWLRKNNTTLEQYTSKVIKNKAIQEKCGDTGNGAVL